MTYRKMIRSRTFIIGWLMLMFLITSVSYSVSGHGSEEVSQYDGPTFLIPYIDYSPVIDGVATADEFPEQGHLELDGLLDEVKVSHNETNIFVSITVDAEEFVGFAVKNRGQDTDEFVYFLTGINGNQTEKMIRVSDPDFDNISGDDYNSIFVSGVKESNDTRVYELMIAIGDGLNPIEGTMFNMIILNGEGEDISSTEVSQSSSIPSLLLRDGEDPAEIAMLLQNNPSWFDVLVFPSILLLLSIYFVWEYKLIVIKKGEN